MKSSSRFSFAKINLFLKILDKRDDGYHDLESVMCYIDLKDKIEYIKGSSSQDPELTLNISGEFAGGILADRNLFTEIFSHFKKEFKIDRDIEINLEKNIPVAAGLGGGSSNGASFIKFLDQKFDLSIAKEDLQNIALKFGCDLPFFFDDESRIIRSKGEILEEYGEFDDLDILLITPNIEVLTSDIFSSIKSTNSTELDSDQIRSLSVIDLINDLPNDLQSIAMKKFPIIGLLSYELKNLGAHSFKMSGSGPSCFAIFEDKSALNLACQKISEKFPNFFTIKTKIISKITDA